MEKGKNDKIVVLTLQGVDLWRGIIEENDRRYIQNTSYQRLALKVLEMNRKKAILLQARPTSANA